ncbi:MAG: dodecin family protein [Alphaproteobacteria bacterium]|uniref:dodecin n=1 Tax=Hyphomonas sp. TaxID=87 RepID=UPI001DD87239|nr:dodecin family protein [Alphaproteobacteria bacterium]MBU2085607.1 dodecin family protein [Alphaproteobacteria bacterium]MBU2141899.1 dodecin family protein [Alphaproteobacteria bacterium]MBU2195729.1 dodecin family protein [Alphaproteobacteria bacterium]
MSADTYAISKIVGTSEKSIEDAIDGALATASKTLRSLDWFDVTSTRGFIQDGKVKYYQVTIELGFKYES